MTDVTPLRGVLRFSDGSREFHLPRFAECPPPPSWLTNERAQSEWRRVAQDMHDRAILAVIHVHLVAMYCLAVAYAEACDAKGLLAEAAEWWTLADNTAADCLLDPPVRPSPRLQTPPNPAPSVVQTNH